MQENNGATVHISNKCVRMPLPLNIDALHAFQISLTNIKGRDNVIIIIIFMITIVIVIVIVKLIAWMNNFNCFRHLHNFRADAGILAKEHLKEQYVFSLGVWFIDITISLESGTSFRSMTKSRFDRLRIKSNQIFRQQRIYGISILWRLPELS